MNTKINVLVLGVLLTLSGCGSDNKGNSNAFQQNSDYCSQEYVSAYNDVQYSVQRTNDVAVANAAINGFEAKYRGVNCRALLNGTDQVASADSLVSKLRAAVASASGSTQSAPANPRASSPTRDGECSSTFISDYNQFNQSIKSATTVEQIDSTIDGFERKYKGTRCKASNNGGYNIVVVDADETVAKARKAFESLPRATKPQVMTPATPVATGNPRAAAIDANIAELNGVSIEVLDADTLNRVKNSNGDLIIQNGKAIALRGTFDPTLSLCTVTAVSVSDFKKGDKINFKKEDITASSTSVSLDRIDSNGGLRVTCMRLGGSNSSAAITVNEIQSIFGRVANVNPIR